MKLSPNETCHCGSGKKYKKCCMLKDEQSARAAAPAPAAPATPAAPAARKPPPPPREEPKPSPEDDKWNALMGEFENASGPRKLELIRQVIDDGAMDADVAFELLEDVFQESVKQRQPELFDDAVAALQQGAPKAYEAERSLILLWQLESALFSGRRDGLARVALDLATLAGEHVDNFQRAIGRLECHGELKLCVRMVEEAWPRVRDSEDVMGFAIDELTEEAARLILVEREERDCAKAEFDDELRKRIEAFGEIDCDAYGTALDHLAGRSDRKWTMADFRFPAVPQPVDPPKPRKDSNRRVRERNLWLLLFEFIGWARREERIAATLANAGARQLQQYVIERGDAGLGPALSMMERMLDPRSAKATRPFPKPEHVLCPDENTIDIFLGRQVNLFSSDLAAATAFAAMTPPWLRFLASRGLIDATARERATLAMAEPTRQLRALLDKQAPALLPILGAQEKD